MVTTGGHGYIIYMNPKAKKKDEKITCYIFDYDVLAYNGNGTAYTNRRGYRPK